MLDAYDIACFAAGMYHFAIPYNLVRDLLTDETKLCIGME